MSKYLSTFIALFLVSFALSTYFYIYLYPRFIMVLTKQKLTNCSAANQQVCAPINTFGHMNRLATPEETIIVNPNNDTLYSSAWLDLSKEPLVVYIPAMHGRYYTLQFLDAWTNVFGYKGRRTDPGESTTIVVGPRWAAPLPKNIAVLRSPTATAWIIGRILVSGPEDVLRVQELQKKLTITPLSTFLHASNIHQDTAKGSLMKSIVINVLKNDVYTDCHIKGSINVPLGELEKYAQKLNKNDDIIVYCAHYQCPASKNAWKILHDLGFTNVKAYLPAQPSGRAVHPDARAEAEDPRSLPS